MKNYPKAPRTGGPSKATASTLCQKCLKKGHYSYECKAATQERPYVSRPSRTQQLFNPKLVPKLSDEVPQDLLRKKGIADEQIAKFEEERGRKRARKGEEFTRSNTSKRHYSASLSSSSVSTISTRLSVSPEPRSRAVLTQKAEKAHFRPSRTKPHSRAKSPSYRSNKKSEMKRNDSLSSSSTHSISDKRGPRSTGRRHRSSSPEVQSRTTKSKSPHAASRRMKLNDNRRNTEKKSRASCTYASTSMTEKQEDSHTRERSLSPFSKRLALTQAMNMCR